MSDDLERCVQEEALMTGRPVVAYSSEHDSLSMSPQVFESLRAKFAQTATDVMMDRQSRYADDENVLAGFVGIAAGSPSVTPFTAWEVLSSKHWRSIQVLVARLGSGVEIPAPADGEDVYTSIRDLRNYLDLLVALVYSATGASLKNAPIDSELG